MHPVIGHPVSSYYLDDLALVIDPMAPEKGLDSFAVPPKNVLLTNRHHYRDCGEFVARFGCTVWCVESGMHEFTKGEEVTAFKFGDDPVAGVTSVEIGSICPDETVFHIPSHNLVSLGDGAVRFGDGPLSFVPEQFMGKDPEGVKSGLKQAYAKLLEHEFDNLLLAHGDPWIGGGKKALRAFIES